MLLKGLLEKEELIKDKFSWKCVLSFIFFSVKKKSRGACTCSTSRDFINLNQIRGEHKKPNFCLSLCIYTAVSIWNNAWYFKYWLFVKIGLNLSIYVSLCKKWKHDTWYLSKKYILKLEFLFCLHTYINL